ncbi:homoserine dehydrogenase [Balnearium lithotrophicum]|uniref:Homoserine dehydrogenase n=1 Tax=Balnearium lithotrophicum TaxID=223788 RepID=A0A521BW49_9BACT|nr:homoserine dehydrogenase [Balnearium lithotrophicum]SMO51414.1 homoserine dehydrogenase [Balnearium lithotrophicum]
MDSFRVGIVGCGTVGGGVVELLLENGETIESRIGRKIEIAFVVDRDTEKPKKLGIPAEKIFADAFKALDVECDAVVELVGGTTFAKEIVKTAIKRKRHVVTANKALLADYGEEIFKLAKENGVSVKFEASVGGGIPVIKAVREGLVGNRIKAIYGIINGTANFILTEMSQRGISFEEALREAQEKGYAEADPSLDVDGYDAAHKIAILSSLAFCRWIRTEEVFVDGIRDLTPLDVEIAKEEFGYAVKLLAISKVSGGEVEVRVHPTMIPEENILSSVNDVFNACLVEGDFVGRTLYYGKGAGRRPTASAVVSDIVDLALGNTFSVPECLFKENREIKLKKPNEFVSSFYLRFTAVDRPGVLARIAEILGRENISIKSALQKNIEFNGGVPIVMTTHPAKKSQIERAVEEIDRMDVIVKPTFVCMVEELQ